MMLFYKGLFLGIVFLLYSCSEDSSNNSMVATSEGSVSSEEYKLLTSSSKADSIKIGSSSSLEPKESSSSVERSSSSLEPKESSSSVERSSSSLEPKESSSSVERSSSSLEPKESSSSVERSSSSLKVLGVCKTKFEDNCTYGSLYDERDGQIYKTVKIGDQWWMAENLRYNDATQSECHPDDPNCDIFGRFYNRNGALNDCPKGWHLPTENEWSVLTQFVTTYSEKGYPGQNLRTDSLWNASELTGYDAFGFSAIPSGGFDPYDGWWNIGRNAFFWTSDSYKIGSQTCYTCARIYYKLFSDAIKTDMLYRKKDICERYSSSKNSVRCIKD